MHVYSLRRTSLASLLVALGMLAGQALAAPVSRTPEIVRFETNPVSTLAPGTELVFRLEGTPQARATVEISGIKQPITLRETSAGWYEGSYTVRSSDRLPHAPGVRATLRRGNRSTTAELDQPLLASAEGPAHTPTIERFTMQSERIEPGAELVFIVEGTPQARALFNIRNVARRMPMTEIQPGVYEGRYTVRRQDRFDRDDVIAVLEANGQRTRAQLSASGRQNAEGWRFGDQEPRGFPLEVTSPGHMAEVSSGPIEIRGRSAPHLPLTVQVEANTSVGGLLGLNRNVMARTVTTDERGHFAFSFEPRLAMPGTHYEVSISGTMDGQEKSRKLTLVQR